MVQVRTDGPLHRLSREATRFGGRIVGLFCPKRLLAMVSGSFWLQCGLNFLCSASRGRIRRQRDPRERRIVFDAAADGTALGYEIQQASTKRDFIAAVILG